MEDQLRDVPDIGPYRVLHVLGEGGMGIVYAAEQRQPIVRRVALKVIKVGMDTKEVLARFAAERQALALLDHPNIAKVLDAGATTEGRPFFAMELVRGIPITRYCDDGRLSLAERITLFLQACAALQHAHERGIVHRDIKPTNLLVAEIDAQPVVKVIDFGLAKATNQRLTERTLFTEEGRIIGTPEYMSPEQAATSTQDVDARSDVFSLGVVLYELLAGTLPFDFKAVRARGYFEVQRLIREEEPPTPTRRLNALRQSLDGILALRRCRLQELARSLRSGLDAVTMKAIAKTRRDRYGSCAEFAADLRRFLAGEPVLARKTGIVGTVAQRVRRFQRRHPAALAALSLATAVGVATWWGMRREIEQPVEAATPPSAGGRKPEPGVLEVVQQGVHEGKRVGEWQFYYESGQPKSRGRCDADQQVGVWTGYYENGRVEWNGAFDRRGKRIGEWVFYRPDGALQARGTYLDDLQDGCWTYFDGGGAIERCGQYDRGKMSGFWQYRQADGKSMAQGLCHLDVRVGPWRTWDDAGKAMSQYYGSTTQIVLVNETWPGGAPRRVGVLEHGTPVGRWTTWHENGAVRFCCGFAGDKVAGAFEARHANGALLAQGVVDAGEFAEPTLAYSQGRSRRIAPGPMPTVVGMWVAASELAAWTPEQAIALLAAEMQSPIWPGALAAVKSAAAGGIEPRPVPEQPRLGASSSGAIADAMRAYGDDQDAVARLEMQERLKSLGVIRTATGAEVKLSEFVGRKRVLLVFTRGFTNQVCVYCSALTEALSRKSQQLAAHNVEPIVIYGLSEARTESFLKAYDTEFGAGPPPYLAAYDPDCQLASTLGILGNLVKPTAILVDENGQVRSAEIGGESAERQVMHAMLRMIDGLGR